MTTKELFAEICDRVRSPLAAGMLTKDPEMMQRQFERIRDVLNEIEERLIKENKFISKKTEHTPGPWTWRIPGYLCNKYINKGMILWTEWDPIYKEYVIKRSNRRREAYCSRT